MSRLSAVSHKVIKDAVAKGVTLGTAESLTGGMIASALAGIPGASRALLGGIVSYDPRIKHELLDVSQEVLDTVGVVSEACARQMALGAQERLGVQIAVSVTGLAGPGGGTADTPVGTVYLAIAGRRGIQVERRHFSGGRQAVRKKTAVAALGMIWDELQWISSVG